MARPRCLDPGQTYLVTRRCAERRFFLRPDSVVNRLLVYCLGVAARRHEIELHAFAFMSNHYHLVLSERSADVRLPEFMGWFNKHIAKLVNILRGRRESLWSPGSYNAVVLADEASVIDKIVYTICNPVAAGLVPTPEAWPGLRSLPSNLERDTFKAERPSIYFSDKQAPGAELRLTRPPCLKGMCKKQYRALIARQVKARLADIHERRAREGLGFLGREAILAQDPEARPSEDPEDQGLRPRLACKDRRRREAILAALKQFGDEHRRCLKAWRAKKRETTFPAGTYGMRRLHNVRCRKGPGVFALE